MPPKIDRRRFLAGIASTAAVFGLAGCMTRSPGTTGPASQAAKQMIWSTYPPGTGTYNDVAALANTLTQQLQKPVRLMTSDTGIGRIAPLIDGTSQFARSADEYYYAFEGDDEFATGVWGPQPVRIVWSPPGNYGVLVREDSGIEKVEDLKGKRFPRLVASTAMNRKLEAILDYGGLTWADVEQVDIGYGAQGEGMRTGEIDVMYQNVIGPHVEELASRYPIRWLNLESPDVSRYKTWEKLAPMVKLGEVANASGTTPGTRTPTMQYGLPISTLAERPTEEIYELCSNIHEFFPLYKDATADTDKFDIDVIHRNPLVVPFHEGTVQFFKDHDRWTPDLERRNTALLEREALMNEAWPDFWDQYSGDEDIADIWREWKRQELPKLPEIKDVA